MTNVQYILDIPNRPNNPSVDQPNMKINTNSINQLIAVDHISFNLNNGGFHTNIHLSPQGTWNAVTRTGQPANTPGIGQAFALLSTPDITGGGSPDTQLFAQTGLGGVSQLTGNFPSADGYVWAGGLLLQWGVVTFASSPATGTITFKNRTNCIPFPSNCYNVVCTPIADTASLPGAAGSANVRSASLTNTGFNWQFSSSSSHYLGFYWLAIGI